MGSDLLPLTIGNLIIELRFLSVEKPSFERSISVRVSEIKNNWLSKWEEKIQSEFNGRLRLWADYVSGLGEDDNSSNAEFRNEVKNRVILNILRSESRQELPDLSLVDAKLKRKLIPSDFIWDAVFQNSFNRNDHWFLYGKLKN